MQTRTSAAGPSSDAIRSAAATIRPYIRRTPVVQIDARLPDLPNVSVSLKLELLQHSGSFKVRGAFANLLLRQVAPDGVVAASGGNHGAAVAFAAGRLGVPAKIFVPRISSPAKIDRIRQCGADLVIAGDSYAEALAASQSWSHGRDVTTVHAYDQFETILGQATLAAELDQQAPDIDTVFVGVGGGGLIAGIAAWYGPRIRLIGVEPELAPTLTRAIAAGKPVDAEAGGIAADSLGPRRIGDQVFPIVQASLYQVLTVSDDQIRAAQVTLWDTLRIVAEPGGAAAFAGLLFGAYRPPAGERVGVIVSGGNTTAVAFTA